jgi:hypothetical protein
MPRLDDHYMTDEEREFVDAAELPSDAMVDEEGNVYVPDPNGEFIHAEDGFLYPREAIEALEQAVPVALVADEDGVQQFSSEEYDEADDDEGYDDEEDEEYYDEDEEDFSDPDEYE